MTDVENTTTVLFQLTAPQGGRRVGYDSPVFPALISTHSPARGPTSVDVIFFDSDRFQLTAPQGGRPSSAFVPAFSRYISTHSPARGPTAISPIVSRHITFQLTAPQGGRQGTYDIKQVDILFQLTAPQGGRQQEQRSTWHHRTISTHSPARGPTLIFAR